MTTSVKTITQDKTKQDKKRKERKKLFKDKTSIYKIKGQSMTRQDKIR